MWKRWTAREPDLRVLMVCTGNICRSPMAEAVLRAKLQHAGLGGRVEVDSAGTHAMPRGTRPDPRAVAAAARRGWDLGRIRARPLVDADFERHGLILAMDEGHRDWLLDHAGAQRSARIALLGEVLQDPARAEVLDPYYQGDSAFDAALDLIEPACDAWIPALRAQAMQVGRGG